MIMNDALVAKTAWRLLRNPDELWARVLKSIYFPQKTFVDSKKGYKASWCWSSIVDGRDFLKKDLLWDIGDGTSIRIWGDNWVPNMQFPEKRASNQDFIVTHGRVSDLIDERVRNIEPFRDLVPTCIITAITQMTLPARGFQDKLVWVPAPNGCYTVKLGYSAVKEKSRPNPTRPGSSCVVAQTSWKFIWKIKTLPQIQHFIWRILNDDVVTNALLFRRKRSPTRICPICEEGEETIEHLFFHCPWTRCIWFGCNLGVKIDAVSGRSFKYRWLSITDVHDGLNDVEISWLCWKLWFIWKQWNDKVFIHFPPDPTVVINLAMNSNMEFWNRGSSPAPNQNMQNMQTLSDTTTYWQPPPGGFLKINCDGAFKSSPTGAALGVLCGDDKGNFMRGFVDKIKSMSAFMTEALALKRALMLAMDMGHDKVIFETDCQLLHNCVQLHQPDLYD